MPAHGGIGSFLPMVRPTTPRAEQHPVSFGGGAHGVTTGRRSSSSRSARSCEPRARRSRGSDRSRFSAPERVRPELFSRFSQDAGADGAVSAEPGRRATDRLLEQSKIHQDDVYTNQINLRYMLTLNSSTPTTTELQQAVPEFLRKSLAAFKSVERRPTISSMRLQGMHDSDTAKELLNRVDQVQWVERKQQGDGAKVQHPRTRFGLVPTMVVARNIGLRNEMEECAGIVLQACVRSHLAARELRLKQLVALWGQRCYRKVRARRQDRARRMEMKRYGRRIAKAQCNLPPEVRGQRDRQAADAIKIKQMQWRIVNDLFGKFKAQQDRDKTRARDEQRARDLQQKRAAIKAVELRVAEEKSTFLTDAESTVWVGRVPAKYTTEHILRPMMECIGKVKSIHIRVKHDVNGTGASWALVMFEHKAAAARSFLVDARAECGLSVTKTWKFRPVQPEKIGSLQAKIAFAPMQVEGLAEDLEIRREQNEAALAAEAEARKRARVDRKQRALDISARWDAIDREQRTSMIRDQKQREVKKKREERKLNHQLLTHMLHVWSSYASVRTRLNALNKWPEIRAATRDVERLMKAGTIPLGRRETHGTVDSQSTKDGMGNNAPNQNLLKWNPTLYIATMNAFYKQQRTLIRSFVSWRFYMRALLNDKTYNGQIRQAAYKWNFYLHGVRDFGLKMKLDRMDGLIDDLTAESIETAAREAIQQEHHDDGEEMSMSQGEHEKRLEQTEEEHEETSIPQKADDDERSVSNDEPTVSWSNAEKDLLVSLFQIE